jgi:hypothetical protein
MVKCSTKTINVIGKTDISTSLNFPVSSFKILRPSEDDKLEKII